MNSVTEMSKNKMASAKELRLNEKYMGSAPMVKDKEENRKKKRTLYCFGSRKTRNKRVEILTLVLCEKRTEYFWLCGDF